MNTRVQITKPLVIAALLFLVCARLEAKPWSLVSCDPAGEAGWRDFEHAMRTAKPGSTVYVPFPFPQTDDQVVRDYLDQHRSLVKGMAPGNMQPNEPRVMAALSAGKVTFQVMRIENWTVSRCRKEQKRDFYNLVRVFEPGAGGIELTRAVVNESGLLVTWNNLPASVPGPVASQSRTLRPEAAVITELNSVLGLNAVDPQYVVTYGSPPLACVFTHPCLAFHHAELSYILFDDQIFELSASDPRLAVHKNLGIGRAQERLLPSLATGESMLSLGGPVVGIARQVDPSMVRSKKTAFRPPPVR
ncbi:MAG TPA: hypothetical protein VHR45_24585 [Thermoanaerobaculia bacterium]|nr:hypothetical protein [Thermoanaerobaculia bacterium]